LNVLVTRAREQVHVVTSIPPEAYRALPEVPAGQAAGGGWLLFAYLKFAEELSRGYHGEDAVAGDSVNGDPGAADAKPQAAEALVNVRPSKEPSAFAAALARKLAEARGIGSDVHWGNEGFCVDVALREDGHVTTGVLCDAARFTGSEDPMEWDVFRAGVLEKQGWTLHRLWTPHFFRDPRGAVKAIVGEPRSNSSPAGRPALDVPIPPPGGTAPAEPRPVAKPASRL
jgi:hypothetical protein